jgi:hypothetical protein
MGATSEARAEPGLADAQPPLDRPWQPAVRIDWPWVDPAGPPPDNPDAASWGALALPVAALAAGQAGPEPEPELQRTEVPLDTATRTQTRGPISSFAVGRGPDTPVVEAELLVHVSARPGTLVDLFGRPLRVGPSGRSTLRIPVTDLASLEQLLGSPADGQRPTGD